ncbi:response regulator transcription factor [Tropicimonas isoalkanivorans]|uniref:Response regulator receiver domain-containing protein n=1 Tax=Tropicimonas isoalkanivorans TaxID=441112 RepID=A0A1I1PGF8_9RHOB|nr:response regulator [Tropicimonas isoalkanivorans]SFD06728.1 Response regulator receiver domain-containing protein [Tropicimonas isoalkanivorans]
MIVLIVESNRDLGWLWKRHLERQGHQVVHVKGQEEAIEILRQNVVGVIILDVVLEEGSAFAVSDFASYRFPDIKVIFVTNTTFFSDGSIFQLAPNACAYLQSRTPPEDLTMMVEHYGAPAR